MEHLLRASRLVKAPMCHYTIKSCAHKKTLFPRIVEVGKLEKPRIGTDYATGQLFLHKVLGYRGVVIFPWVARVFDRDVLTKHQTMVCLLEQHMENIKNDENRIKGNTHTFYQALIDSRDRPHIRAQAEAVTFLGDKDNDKSMYAIPGIDYVAHDDILPYKSTEIRPIQHELFDKFLIYLPTKDKESVFSGHETLEAWQKKNRPWLELSDVHKETTENIRVTVIPFYMGTRNKVFWWRYCVRIENLGKRAVQLRKTYWRIFSLDGKFKPVRETGAVGLKPYFDKGSPAFQYSSHVSLKYPRGIMWGNFRMEHEDGKFFDCHIPEFSLKSKSDEEYPKPPTVSL